MVIRDRGGGTPPQVRGRLFTRRFTNEENGQDICLTMVQEILLSRGFCFSPESDPPRPHRFRDSLPTEESTLLL